MWTAYRVIRRLPEPKMPRAGLGPVRWRAPSASASRGDGNRLNRRSKGKAQEMSATTAVEEVAGAENEIGVDGCPTVEHVRELYVEAQAARVEHGADSREAAEAFSSFEAAREQLWRADGWTPPSAKELAQMHRRGVDDYNHRLAVARAESGAAAARSVRKLYASLRRQAIKAASAGSSPRPRTTPRARERHSSTSARRTRAPSGHSEGSEPPPGRCRRCDGELTGRQRDFCSKKCNAAHHMAAKRARDRDDRDLVADGALLELGKIGRKAIADGADPALTLSYIVWPTPRVLAALRVRERAAA